MKLASLVEMQLLLYKDFFKHQAEALPHSESIQSFCVKNKVPYNIFSKWHKDTDVHEIIVKSSVNFLSHNDRALQSQFKQKQKIAGLFYVERKLRHEKCYKSDVYPKQNTYNN